MYVCMMMVMMISTIAADSKSVESTSKQWPSTIEQRADTFHIYPGFWSG